MQAAQQESNATRIKALEQQVQYLQQEKAALQKQVTLVRKAQGYHENLIQNLPLGPAVGFWARPGCLEQGVPDGSCFHRPKGGLLR